MPPTARRAAAALLAIFLAALAACAAPPAPTPTPAPTATLSPTATPTPTPTPAPTATPTPAPTATPTPAPSPTRPPSPTAAASPTGTAAANALPAPILRAITGLDTLRSYRVAGAFTTRDSGRLDIRLDYVAPDRRRLDLGGIQIVQIGQTSYVNLGGIWTRADGAAAVPAVATADIRDLARDFATARFTAAGQEAIDGDPCAAYTFEAPDQSGKVWVSTATGHLRRIDGTAEGGDYTLVISDHNQPITIDPPV